MYVLIQAGLASKMELEEYYTLDEALKLYALYGMKNDVERCSMEDARNNRG